MKKILYLGIFLLGLLVLVTACSQQEPAVQCNAPYKILGSKCCLDENNNNVCDDEEQKNTQKECKRDADCELDACIGCINAEWAKANPVRPECDRFGLEEYECKCVNNDCTEVEKTVNTKVMAGDRIRFGEEKLPLTLEMQKDTRILFVTATGDEVYTLNSLQESQITIFYGKDRFIIKKGTTQAIGPLVFVYSGVNPPKSGNYAVIKVIKA